MAEDDLTYDQFFFHKRMRDQKIGTFAFLVRKLLSKLSELEHRDQLASMSGLYEKLVIGLQNRPLSVGEWRFWQRA